MKRFVLCALLSTAALSACSDVSPTAVAPAKPVTLIQDYEELLPTDPTIPGDGGGCVDCGGGDPYTPPYVPPTSTVQYRLSVGLYRDGGDMKAFSRFERSYDGWSWSKTDVNNLAVYCYVNGALRDGETESRASSTTVTFGVSYYPGKTITCNHSASYGAYTASTSYVM